MTETSPTETGTHARTHGRQTRTHCRQTRTLCRQTLTHGRHWDTHARQADTHALQADTHALQADTHARTSGRHARTHCRQTRTHALSAGRHARTHWTLAAQTHRCWFSLVKFYSPGRLARKNMRKWQGVQNQQKPSPVKCRIYQNSRDSDHFLAQWLPVTVRLLSFWQVSKSKTILLSFLLLNFLRR